MGPTLSLAFALTISLTSYSAQAAAPAAVSAALEKNVDTLEVRLFQHDYSGEAIDDRLTRLEKMVFGESRSGAESHRVADLLAALPKEAPEAPTPAPKAAGNGQQQVAAAQDAPPEPITDSSQYPHVTALEHELLGQTHENQPINQRLSQLEQKAFGKPSGSTDLSERTDHLEHYVEVHLHIAPYARNPEMEVADSSPIRYGGGGAIPASYHAPSAPQAPPSFMPAPSSNAPMLDKVTWMEGQVFGQTYSEDHLLERLRRIDQTLFPNEAPTADMKLMDQVDSMVGAVQMMQHQRQTGSAPQLIASAPDAAINAYKRAQPDVAQDEEVAGPSTTNKAKNHSFDKQLAHCLGEAGNMALGMTGNSFAGQNMGGGGPGYWY